MDGLLVNCHGGCEFESGPGQLTPPPLQLSIQNNLTKKTAELDLICVFY